MVQALTYGNEICGAIARTYPLRSRCCVPPRRWWRSLDFRFVRDFSGLEVIKSPASRSPTTATMWCASYDNTGLVMPSMSHREAVATMVRLSSIEAAG